MTDTQQHHLRLGLARKVHLLRRERGWTQQELARLLGLSQSRFSEIENGQGSFSAEQFLLLLKTFNIPLHYFVSAKGDPVSVLQNSLVRLGASHLQENQETIPSEHLADIHDVIRETLVSAESARQITALAPVLVQHAKRISFHKLKSQLAKLGLESRLGWVLENTLVALRHEPSETLPRKTKTLYHQAEAILARHLSSWTQAISVQGKPEEDILDRDVISEKSVQQVRSTSSSIAKKWHIVTRIEVEDFIKALKATRGSD